MVKLKESSIGKRFGQVLYALSFALSTANGALQLPHNVHQALVEFGAIEQPQLTYDLGQSAALIEVQAEHQEADTSQNPTGNAQRT